MSVAGSVLATSVVLGTCVGCTLSKGQPNIDKGSWLFEPHDASLNSNSGAASYYPDKVCPKPKGIDVDDFVNPSPGKPTVQATNIRKCVDALKILVDLQWYDYADALWSSTSAGNSAVDAAKLGLTGAATAIVGPTAQVLSGVATFLAGVQTTFNQDYFYSKTLQLTVLQMQKDRASQADTILKQLNAYAYADMYEAANDLLEYARAGSWTHALTTMEADTGAQTAACSNQLKATKNNNAAKLSGAAPATNQSSTVTQPCPPPPEPSTIKPPASRTIGVENKAPR